MIPWIKVEVTTPDKPEIVGMAARLRIDQDAVVGKCLRVWAWADQNSVNGAAIPITAAFLDRMTDRKGFAEALRSVGWLSGEDGALTFPGFDRHNGATAKARAETNRRVAAHRERNDQRVTPAPHRDDLPSNGNVTEDSLPKPLPDKSRVEEKHTDLTPSPRGRGRTTSWLDHPPEGWPKTEAQARSLAETIGVQADMAATFWHHFEAMQEWPPGSFANVMKAKAGFRAEDLAADIERDKARAAARSPGPSHKPATSTQPKNGW